MNIHQHPAAMKFRISRFQHNRDTTPDVQDYTWEGLKKLFAAPTRLEVSEYEFHHRMGEKERTRLKNGPCYIAGEAQGGKSKTAIVNRSLVVLDVDENTLIALDKIKHLTCAWLYHSTTRSRKDSPRIRIIIPLDRSVDQVEYSRLVMFLTDQVGGQVDDCSKKVAQLMYLPRIPSSSEYLYEVHDGPWLDVDQALAQAPLAERRIMSSLPDITKLRGMEGEFCRRYSVAQAIDEFLPHVYEPSDREDRYHYIGSSSGAGLVIYENGWATSFHTNSDPAAKSRSVNAYALVRIHKFEGDREKMDRWCSETLEINASASIYQHSDSGYAQYLAHHPDVAGALRYDPNLNRWYEKRGAQWKVNPVGPYDVTKYLEAELLVLAEGSGDEKMSKKLRNTAVDVNNMRRIGPIITRLRKFEELHRAAEQFDAHRHVIGCEGSVVNLNTGQEADAEEEYYVTMSTGVKHRSGEGCPKWLQFLDDVFKEDADDLLGEGQELIDYIQVLMGHTLYGGQEGKKFVILHGDGSNGKTVFLEVLSKVFGDYAGTFSPDAVSGRNFGNSGHNENVAVLKGVRMAYTEELGENKELKEEVVKGLTGGGAIQVSRKGEKSFTFRPEFNVFAATNFMPRIKGADHGIWRRVIPIPFKITFGQERGQKPVKLGLKDELLREASGILNWAIEGYQKYKKSPGILDQLPTICKAEKEEYREESDSILAWFREMVKVTDIEEVEPIQVRSAHEMYTDWCGRSRTVQSEQAFGRRLPKLGAVKKVTKTGKVYTNLTIREKKGWE